MSQPHPNPVDLWKNRRRMAYWSMSMLTLSLVMALTGRVPEPQMPLVEGLCWIFGTVIILYFGGNAAEEFARRRSTAMANDSGNARPVE